MKAGILLLRPDTEGMRREEEISRIMDMRYLMYFVIGGTTVSIVTYLVNQSRGLLAAFISNLPVITAMTFTLIYLQSGQKAVVTYASGLIVMLFPWLTYIFSIILMTPRFGFVPSIATGISLYLISSYLIMTIKK